MKTKLGYKTLTKEQLIKTLGNRDEELADAYKLIRLLDEQINKKKQIRVFFHGTTLKQK